MKQHILLLVVFAMAVFFAIQYLLVSTKYEQLKKNGEAELRNRFPIAEAIVFKRDMPRNTLITSDDLAIMNLPVSSIRPNKIRAEEAAKLIGKRVVNNVPARYPVFWSDIENDVLPEQ